MARKGQISIQDNIESEEDFQNYLDANYDKLICLEIYSEFCGPCNALGNALKKVKIEIGQDRVALAKKRKVCRLMFGANGILMIKIFEEELDIMAKEEEAGYYLRPKYELDEMVPEEAEKSEARAKLEREILEAEEKIRVTTLALRKKRVCERLAAQIPKLNFILFWPHCHHAHLELYENLYDNIAISVVTKEVFQPSEELVKEIMYMSDLDMNEAAMHFLTTGDALVVMFKIEENDRRDFVKLLRRSLYEDPPIEKPDLPPEKQLPPIPAFVRYSVITKSKREVRRERHTAKLERLAKEQEEAERLAAEQARIKRQEDEERQKEEAARQEKIRFERIQAGLPPEPEIPAKNEEEEEEEEEINEELGEHEAQEEVSPEQEFHSDVSLEGEDYIPPGGLFVPGLYTPPNDLAKANALAYLFPKFIASLCPIESEYLPPHLLVMFPADKRHEIYEVIKQYRSEILALGFFTGDEPSTAEHLAYSIKQYDAIDRKVRYKDRLAVMVSRKRSLPLLQLAGFNPCYISPDLTAGEMDCLTMFPVGYGDDFYEEPSLVEEEGELEAAAEEHVANEAEPTVQT